MTTSATGSPQLASQAPADMQIISADDIRRSGATNIPDILEFVAGIDVRNEGALNSEIAIRGFSQGFNRGGYDRLLAPIDSTVSAAVYYVNFASVFLIMVTEI